MRPDCHPIPDITGPVKYQPLLAVLQEQGAEGLPPIDSIQYIFAPWEVAPVADAPTPAAWRSGWLWLRVAVITAVLLRAWREAQLA